MKKNSYNHTEQKNKKIIIEYRDLKFYPSETGEEIKCIFMKYFTFQIKIDNLPNLIESKEIKLTNGLIILRNQKYENKITREIDKNINNLMTIIDNKPAVFIYEGLGIPLIGANSFGIVDRNTNWIEVKPITLCNFDCIFCSVSPSLRKVNYVLSEEYIIKTLNEIVKKKHEKVNIFINAHGEPLLYSRLNDLIKDMRKNSKINKILLVTNGSLLTQEKITELFNLGLTELNISIHSLNPENAKKLTNSKYNITKLKKLILKNKDKNIVLTPVFMKGINDKDIEELVEFCAENKIRIEIQNYLEYSHGKRPIKSISMEEFYNILREWEKEYNTKLINTPKDFIKDTVLNNPFKKGEIIKLKPIIPGRLPNEIISSSRNRAISIILKRRPIPLKWETFNKKQMIKCEVIRTKHNIITCKEI